MTYLETYLETVAELESFWWDLDRQVGEDLSRMREDPERWAREFVRENGPKTHVFIDWGLGAPVRGEPTEEAFERGLAEGRAEWLRDMHRRELGEVVAPDWTGYYCWAVDRLRRALEGEEDVGAAAEAVIRERPWVYFEDAVGDWLPDANPRAVAAMTARIKRRPWMDHKQLEVAEAMRGLRMPRSHRYAGEWFRAERNRIVRHTRRPTGLSDERWKRHAVLEGDLSEEQKAEPLRVAERAATAWEQMLQPNCIPLTDPDGRPTDDPRETVRKALTTPLQRELVETMYFGERTLTLEETAERLGMSHAAARQLHSRILKTLRARIARPVRAPAFYRKPKKSAFRSGLRYNHFGEVKTLD